MSRIRILKCLVVIGVLLWNPKWVSPALAQEQTPASNSACKSCHETRYWLYDSGKWCCLCGKQGECVDCHGGVDSEWDEDLAHQGMVSDPITENPQVCQDCHPEDYEARIERFATAAGVHLHAPCEPTSTPYSGAGLVNAGAPTSPDLQVQPMESWQTMSLFIIGLFSVGLILFGYRCWKTDCPARRQLKI